MLRFRPPLPVRSLELQSSSMNPEKFRVTGAGTDQLFPRASPKTAKHDVPGVTLTDSASANMPKSEREFAGTEHSNHLEADVLLMIELPLRVNPSAAHVMAGNDKKKSKQPDTHALAGGPQSITELTIAKQDNDHHDLFMLTFSFGRHQPMGRRHLARRCVTIDNAEAPRGL